MFRDCEIFSGEAEINGIRGGEGNEGAEKKIVGAKMAKAVLKQMKFKERVFLLLSLASYSKLWC